MGIWWGQRGFVQLQVIARNKRRLVPLVFGFALGGDAGFVVVRTAWYRSKNQRTRVLSELPTRGDGSSVDT